MERKSLKELRKLFIDFFVNKGHMPLESFSLVPEDDGSLLFINSGMAPMKKWFLGQQKPPSTRVVTVQKCLRTGDLERVGKTDRHGTFFEMLGNFSFGDYFKREAIFYSWEFVVNVLNMPKEKLYVTTYKDDEEAYNIWKNEVKVLPSHIFKLDKEDNFWEIGLGPCGPCSEIYFDRGEDYGCKKENCAPGCDCDRFVEFWNLVFSQYDNKGNGKYEEMAKKNIDTGMGLERLACLFQGVSNLFEIDSIKKILDRVCDIAKYRYGSDSKKDEYVRVITDHMRSIVFLIGDGVSPSNEGRGYVLRRLIRRAKKSGRKLLVFKTFLKELVGVVVDENYEYYESLKNNMEHICKVVEGEEKSFEKILETTEEKANVLFCNLKEKKVENLYYKLKELIVKENANLLAFKEKMFSFFYRLRMEFERFFNFILQETIDSSLKNEFENKKEILKKEAKSYFFRLKDVFFIFFKWDDLRQNHKNRWNELEKEIDYFFESIDIYGVNEEKMLENKNILQKVVDFCCENIETVIKKFTEVFIDFCNKEETFENYIKKDKSSLGLKEEKLEGFIELIFNLGDALGYSGGYVCVQNFLSKYEPVLSGKHAFKLCDTYGLPFDILKDMAQEAKIKVDEEGFFELLNQQKKRSKEFAQFKDVGWNEEKENFLKNLSPTNFIGYEKLECEAEILYCALKKEVFEVVFNATPFYAVAGGQKADIGNILDVKTGEILGEVLDVKKTNYMQYIHTVKNRADFKFFVGQKVKLVVDFKVRKATEKNHTAAHLLHSALKNIFGDHIRQAGQYVDDKRIRFDFNCFEALKADDLKRVENLVNDVILKGLEVNIENMKREEAQKKGAIALFSEKYGDVVRVVDVVGFSTELCGGTHVKNTKDIGIFKILTEASVGAGVRRIEAITGFEVNKYFENLEQNLEKLCNIFKTKEICNLPDKAYNLNQKFKKVQEDFNDFKIKICEKEFFENFDEKCKKISNFNVMYFKEDILDKSDLPVFADILKKRVNNLIVLIFAKLKEKNNIVVVCGGKAVENKANAADIVKKLAAIGGGKGGGKKDFAVAGIGQTIEENVLKEEFFRIIEKY